MELDRDLASIQEVRNLLKQAQKAQEVLKSFSVEQVEKVVDALRVAGEANACHLASMAVSETGMGKYEDKCFKNFFAARYVYEYIKDMKTVGIIRKDETKKIIEIADPVGVIAGIVPTTNPTSTVIYKAMIALKSRNAIVFSPHPSAVRCTIEAVRIMNQAAVAAGAPEGVISGITNMSLGATQELMTNPITKMILATGGPGLVKAAYSSGTPALGVGAGNPPAFVERTADIAQAAKYIVTSKAFDNGTICATEQSVVVEACVAAELKEQLKRQGAYFLDPDEVEKVGKVAILSNRNFGMNPKTVGRNPQDIAALAGINVPADAKILVAPLSGVGPKWPLSYEKLTTILGYYEVKDWHEGCERCMELINNGGIGHSLAIHSNNQDIITEFAMKKPINRILVNTPSSLGGVGASTSLAPSFTLGSGTWGGSSISENVSPLHLINIKRVAWHLRMPQGPVIQPRAAVDASTAGTTVDVNLVQTVVEQVMKAMKAANM